jgi:hypothetical protein
MIIFNPVIELIKSSLFNEFPSGSSINYYNGNLYVIGDDANTILILKPDYEEQEHIRVFNFPEKRIPKAEKADYETSTIVIEDNIDYLLVFGSASKKNRRKGSLIRLEKIAQADGEVSTREIDYAHFIKRVKNEGIKDINLEGCAIVGSHFLFSNRANDDNPTNQLIITESDFWNRQEVVSIRTLDLTLKNSNVVFGVSEMCYVESMDRLLMTLSSEATDSVYEDGAIGDSCIGWIDAISTKMHQSQLSLDGLFNLSDCNEVFKGEKIEGLCVERVVGNELVIHLVSDNDQGVSKLFAIKMLID